MNMVDSNSLPPETPGEMVEDSETSPSCRGHLVVDLGTSYTVVTLYDIVKGQYRFISRGTSLTTARAPWFDLKLGFIFAVNQIAEATGRRLINSQGYLICPSRLDGSGVDCFGVVASAADPLRTVLIGLLEDVSLASARKALKTIYSLEMDRFSLSDNRSDHRKLESLLMRDIDLAVIVGGSDGGSDRRLLDQVETLSIALDLLDDFRRPRVLYAANVDLRQEVTEDLRELSDVLVTDNIRPSIDYEDIDEIISLFATEYMRQKFLSLPGNEGIRDASTLPTLPTAHAFGGIMEYFSSLHQGKVVGLDIGSGSVSLVVSDPGEIDLFVRSDLGLGSPIANVLKKNRLAEIYSWTDGQTRSTEVRDFILNKSIMAHTLPQDPKELVIEQAIAGLLTHEIASELNNTSHVTKNGKLGPIKLLVLRGGILTKSPSDGYPLLAVIDGLKPVGVFRVLTDTSDVLPAMGLMATHNPQLVVQVLDSGVLTDVGWVVVADGKGELGKPVLRLSMDLGGGKSVKRDIKYGALELIRLAPGTFAELMLQPAAGIDIGKVRGNQQNTRSMEVHSDC